MRDFDPQWGRYGVKPNTAFSPVGDPNRWGASVSIPLPAGFGTIAGGDQFLQAKTLDPYSRSWSLVGTLQLPKLSWDQMGAGLNPFIVALDVFQGVGQATVNQSICLCFTVAGGVPLGLCLQQDFTFGGPFFHYNEGIAPNQTQTRSFAAIGALVGHTIAIAPRIVNGAGAPAGAVVNLSVVLTPYAAGQNL